MLASLLTQPIRLSKTLRRIKKKRKMMKKMKKRWKGKRIKKSNNRINQRTPSNSDLEDL